MQKEARQAGGDSSLSDAVPLSGERMRLKSFGTYGFKSFADKTELTFDKGITAIVGPNGSGKSNISDAIRWVLGEQSAKYLRGSKMEDVIFSGSGKRRALGMAEVTLNFDNEDRALPLDFAEVSLTRRLFRSGDSEYAINRKSCRLKDIVDLLADTGLGKGSMSIIGQNKIDEILNSRPEERRALFEEAAGIAKYRLRRKDAARRLENTAANLTRINDIKCEVERQVEPLRLAAAKTAQYNSLNKELRGVRLTGILRRLDKVVQVREQLQAQKQALEDELAQAGALLAQRQAEVVRAKAELDALAERWEQLQSEAGEKEKQAEANKGRLDVLAERSQQSRRQIERLEEACARSAARAGELERQMQQLAAEFDRVDKLREQAQLQAERLTQAKEKCSAELASVQERDNELRSAFFEDMQELLRQRNELTALEREQEQRVRRRAALKESIEKAQEQADLLEQQYRGLLEGQSRCRLEGQQALEEYKRFKEQAEAGGEEQRRRQNGQQECQRRLTAAETRAQSLQRLQDAYEGFGYGIKSVLRADAAAHAWRSGIIGAVAELIRAEDRLVTAVETALGEGAQNLITLDAATAKQAISYLKSTGGGRATFLPLDTVQQRFPSAEEARLAQLPGILGYAADLISFDSRAEKAVRFLLGRVLLAENIDAALAAARAGRFRVRVVTLEGDVVNAGGSMSGGSKKQREGYLSRAREIEQAAAAEKSLRREMLDWQEQLEAGEHLLQELTAKMQTAQQRVQQCSLRYKEQEQQLNRLAADKKEIGERLSYLLDARTAVAGEYLASRDRLRALREAVQALESRDSSTKEALEELAKRMKALGSEQAALTNRLTDALAELNSAAEKSKYMGERMQNLDADTAGLQNEIKAARAEQERLQGVIDACGKQSEELAAANAALLQELGQLVAGRERYIEERALLNAGQQQAENAAEEARRSLQQQEGRLQKLELELTRQAADCEHTEEQLTAEYQLTPAEARLEDLSAWQELGDKALQRQESRLLLAITELGPINAAAEEEYAAVKERSEFLQKQYDDLAAAKDNLETVISEINSGMKNRFAAAFGEINGFFARCYQKLFGGGTALLQLTEPEDVLNSGIEIQVQPPGKKLQSLYLMSGGERALTVIALLFALLSYRPAPFCILDEIDAALDDANILRFSGFLRDYAGKTQFIVITHRKGTMECADIMYGVTMEESGVSKLLSVKINAKE